MVVKVRRSASFSSRAAMACPRASASGALLLQNRHMDAYRSVWLGLWRFFEPLKVISAEESFICAHKFTPVLRIHEEYSRFSSWGIERRRWHARR